MKHMTKATYKAAFFLIAMIHSSLVPGQEEKKPCATEEHNQFDFWVGDWEVFSPDGKLVGRNSIQKILGNCVVFENWVSSSGKYAGKSFNTYDANAGTWNQVWVDTGGSTIHFSGKRTGNVMQMHGEHGSGEEKVHYEMNYTLNKDGTVRQLWRQSKDREKWDVIFDGLYKSEG